jgi:hypothetical protein
VLWLSEATVTTAIADISTYSGTNHLQIQSQNGGGNIYLNCVNGKVGIGSGSGQPVLPAMFCVGSTNQFQVSSGGAVTAVGLSTSGGLTVSGGTFSSSQALAGTLGGRTAWTPTITGSGAMTVASTTITNATYIRIGPLVWFELEFGTTLGGTLNQYVSATLPFTAASIGGRTALSGDFSYTDSSHWQPGYVVINNGATTVAIVVPNGGSFTTSGVTYFAVSGIFAVA